MACLSELRSQVKIFLLSKSAKGLNNRPNKRNNCMRILERKMREKISREAQINDGLHVDLTFGRSRGNWPLAMHVRARASLHGAGAAEIVLMIASLTS